MDSDGRVLGVCVPGTNRCTGQQPDVPTAEELIAELPTMVWPD